MMTDLIDRAALLAKIRPVEEDDCKYAVLMSDAKSILSKFIGAAPAVDAVEVVRCKDCKHFLEDGMCNNDLGLLIAHTTDFCSYGERKEGEANE